MLRILHFSSPFFIFISFALVLMVNGIIYKGISIGELLFFVLSLQLLNFATFRAMEMIHWPENMYGRAIPWLNMYTSYLQGDPKVWKQTKRLYFIYHILFG